MTDQELQGIAVQALNMARTDYEQGQFDFILGFVGTESRSLHRMRLIEEMLVEKLGPHWLNHGGRKDAGFLMLAYAVSQLPPLAVCMVTGVNRFEGTEKFYALPPEEQLKLVDSGHGRHHEAVREGLLTMQDAFVSLVQTKDRVCFCTVNRKALSAQPETKFCNQTELEGRIKLYGHDPETLQAELSRYFKPANPLRRGSQ